MRHQRVVRTDLLTDAGEVYRDHFWTMWRTAAVVIIPIEAIGALLIVLASRRVHGVPTANFFLAAAERLDVLNERSGVWRCRTAFNCTDACPRDIKVTQAIEEVKREILYSRV